MFVWVWAALLSCVAGLPVLSDPPVVGSVKTVFADWKLTSSSSGDAPGNVAVPGDLVSDLFHSGLIPEPHTDHNWLTYSSEWWEKDWTYQTTFDAPAGVARHVLVLDGVKMGAHVALNGQALTDAPNQFLRYTFDVTSLVRQQDNTLTLTFPRLVNNSTGIDTGGRFMACSGGWDWAPYGNHFDTRGSRLQSRGIWKDAYLVSWDTVLVHSVVPVVYALPGALGQFAVNVTIHYSAVASTVFDLRVGWSTRRLRLAAPSTGGSPSSVTVVQNVTLSADQLWFPRRARLFNVSACNTALGGCFYHTRVGFRSVRLVTAASAGGSGDGSGNRTMRLEVNGQPVLLRGANWIPSTLFEGLASGADLRASVASAGAAGFNVLRVWGGGVYQYEDFYEACDELGILLYHDMMMTSSGMENPVAPPASEHAESYLDEITYQIRRLAPHPSIVIYDACNECGVAPVFQQVFPRIVREDISRVMWPASPSNGWASGVATATGLATGFGAALVPNPQWSWYGGQNEQHGPYLHGTGAPYVNDPSGALVLFDSLVPPPLPAASAVGPNAPGVFVSEFGCVGMSSAFSMNATLSEASRSLHSDDMLLRNYPCDSLLVVYFGAVGPDWSLNLYACMQAQALYLTGRIAAYRAANVWGIQIWQLNEIFPTGGWGTIETASATISGRGQVLGGRWKPAHYALQTALYPDNFFFCGADARCVMRRDAVAASAVKYELSFVSAVTGEVRGPFLTVSDSIVSPFSASWFCAGNASEQTNCAAWEQLSPFPKNSTVIQVLRGSDGPPFFMPLAPPLSMELPPVQIDVEFGEEFSTILTSSAFAALVWLTADGCQPMINSLYLLPNRPIFVPWQLSCDFARVKQTLVVNHARQYLDSLA